MIAVLVCPNLESWAQFSLSASSYILRVNPRRRRHAKHRRRERRLQEQLGHALKDLYDDSLMYDGFEDYETDDDYGLLCITFGEPAS